MPTRIQNNNTGKYLVITTSREKVALNPGDTHDILYLDMGGATLELADILKTSFDEKSQTVMHHTELMT